MWHIRVAPSTRIACEYPPSGSGPSGPLTMVRSIVSPLRYLASGRVLPAWIHGSRPTRADKGYRSPMSLVLIIFGLRPQAGMRHSRVGEGPASAPAKSSTMLRPSVGLSSATRCRPRRVNSQRGSRVSFTQQMMAHRAGRGSFKSEATGKRPANANHIFPLRKLPRRARLSLWSAERRRRIVSRRNRPAHPRP